MNDYGSNGRRYSSHAYFWYILIFVMAISHAWIYAAAAKNFPAPYRYAWIFFGAAAVAASVVAPHIGPPRGWSGRVTLRSALQRGGAFWNFVVLFTAAFMLIFNVVSLIRFIRSVTSFQISFLAAFALSAYGLFEAANVQSSSFTIMTDKLARGERLRVVQISDLHVGPFMNIVHISRIVRKALDAGADLIVVTGDVVDGKVGDGARTLPFYEPFSRSLLALSESGPRLGVWGVPGNHDHYENIDDSLHFMRDSGINPLRGEKADLGPIVLIGADDMDHTETSYSDESSTKSEELILSLSPEERKKFVLLLRHRPVVEAATLGTFDLQLSGHTHGGQILPLPSSRHRIPGRTKGALGLPCGSSLYVSNGAGFVGPPMRFFAPAEIVVIDLTGK
jgi:predicted MPP superfamily phosphohydrolase